MNEDLYALLEPVNEALGYPVCGLCGCVDGCLLEKGVEDGKHKLQHIIDREGDAGGERRQDYYLVQLIAEAIRSRLMSAYCLFRQEERAPRLPASAPIQN